MNRTVYGHRKRRQKSHRRHGTGALTRSRFGSGRLPGGRFGSGQLPSGRFGTGKIGGGRFGILSGLLRARAKIKPRILLRGSLGGGRKPIPALAGTNKFTASQLRSIAARRGSGISTAATAAATHQQKPILPGRTWIGLTKGRESATRTGRRLAAKRFGYTTQPNSIERTAPKKGQVNRFFVSSASGNSNKRNPPVSKWNPGPMRLNRIWSQFTPRFGTAAAGGGTLAAFNTHFGALGSPLNLFSPYEAEQLTRRNMALGPTMAERTARVAAGTIQRPYVPRGAAQ